MAYQITGVKPGEAKITITSTTSPSVKTALTVTVPNLWRYPALPVSNSGITFTADDDGVHAKGTATSWANCQTSITLEAGDYELSATTPSPDVYASLVTPGGQTAKLSTRIANPHRGTIPAGTYLMRVGVAASATVDATITPTLTRIN